MRTIAIFAGAQREFFHYLEEQILPKSKVVTVHSSGKAVIDDVRYIYIGEVDRALRGLRDFKVVRYGTWMNRSTHDLDLLEQHLRREQ